MISLIFQNIGKDAATKIKEGRFTDNQQTHIGSGLKAALHSNARSTGGSAYVSVP
jgi:hypothetical protein